MEDWVSLSFFLIFFAVRTARTAYLSVCQRHDASGMVGPPSTILFIPLLLLLL